MSWVKYPWPKEIPGIGTKCIGPYEVCFKCRKGTWVYYGDKPYCLSCAVKLVGSL